MTKNYIITKISGTFTTIKNGKPKTENFTKTLLTTKKLKDDNYYSEVEKTFSEKGLLTIDSVEHEKKTYTMSDEDFINHALLVENKGDNKNE